MFTKISSRKLNRKMTNRKTFTVEPINLVMGTVAILGAVLIIIGNGNYGLIALIIATLIEAIQRVVK